MCWSEDPPLGARKTLQGAWQSIAGFLGLIEPEDPRNRLRGPPKQWPLRQPALVGYWRPKIGGGVEWCWTAADRSATVLPFKATTARTRERTTGDCV
jgi:hypothetical protein